MAVLFQCILVGVNACPMCASVIDKPLLYLTVRSSLFIRLSTTLFQIFLQFFPHTYPYNDDIARQILIAHVACATCPPAI